jgi:nucleotide-binding universal stress UspA family protein
MRRHIQAKEITMRYPVFAAVMAPDEVAAMPACVKAAFVLAERLQGPLSVAIGALELKAPVVLARATVGGLVAAENKRCRDNAEALCTLLGGSPAPAGTRLSCETIAGDLAELRQRFAGLARLHGFAATQTSAAGDLMQPAVVETLLFETGRPVLVAPHDFAGAVSFDVMLIAWDGSHTAARALWNALPLMQAAKRIVIASITGEKELGKAAPASEISHMLAAVGVKADSVSLPMSGPSVAATLLEQAKHISAGLIVLGAYGHARWREFVFGGVTRDMLSSAKLPMLMSN